MQTQSDRTTMPRRLTVSVGLLLIALGAANLAGWIFDITALKSILPNLPKMHAKTATAMLFCSRRRSRRIDAMRAFFRLEPRYRSVVVG